MGGDAVAGELRAMAAQALAELIRQGRVGAGDLIRLLAMAGEDGEAAPREYVIQVREE